MNEWLMFFLNCFVVFWCAASVTTWVTLITQRDSFKRESLRRKALLLLCCFFIWPDIRISRGGK